MAIRSALRSLLSTPAARVVEEPVREMVERMLAAHPYATTADLEAMRREGALGADEALIARVRSLEDKLASIEKKLGMTVGAMQASTAQLMSVRATADEAHAMASQASQHATTARSTAEAAADAITGVESQLGSLASAAPATRGQAAAPVERAPAKPGPTRKTPAKKKQPAHPTTVVDDRGRAHFEGIGTWRVGVEHVGKTAERRGTSTYVEGHRVRAQKLT